MTKAIAGSHTLLRLGLLTTLVLATAGPVVAATSKPAKPSIRNFLPRGGVPGTVITITGSNLSGATSVKVGGLKVTYVVRSATRVTATLPSTGRSGKVSVTTKTGTATSTGSFSVYAPDGSGTVTTPITSVPPGSSGNVVSFTYTAATGGMTDGAVSITVPSGWSAPVTTSAAGCTSATLGTVTTSGQTITDSGLTLAAGATTVITYGATSGGACSSADGASAPTSGGAATWQVQQKSFSTGTLTNLATSPSIAIYAANGSGTLTSPITSVGPSETGDIISFTFTAATGGMDNGVVTITVPTGWTAPVTANAIGCTSATVGTVTTSGQTITVSGLTLAGAATTVVTYGAASGGSCSSGDGVTSGSSAGAVTFAAQEASTASGGLAALASSPSITVT